MPALCHIFFFWGSNLPIAYIICIYPKLECCFKPKVTSFELRYRHTFIALISMCCVLCLTSVYVFFCFRFFVLFFCFLLFIIIFFVFLLFIHTQAHIL